MFFFEKKNQKTFLLGVFGLAGVRAEGTKVFCLFSSEKKTLLFAFQATPRAILRPPHR
jgi:hypothetical protein